MAETQKNYTFVYKITRKKTIIFKIDHIIRPILAFFVKINYNVNLAA